VKPTPGDTNPRTVNLSSCPPPLRADMRRGPCCTRSRDCRDSIGERDAGERQAAAGAGLPRRWALVGSVESRSVGLGSLARAVGPPSPPRNPIRHLSGHWPSWPAGRRRRASGRDVSSARRRRS